MTRESQTVSIGMPVYNGERFLRESLDSVLAQTYADFELIISDNASIDATEDICRAYAKGDRRIRYYRNDVNLGLARNFNLAFTRSSGKYFRWSSADDLFASDSLKSCVEVLDAHPEVVLCYPKTILIDENGKIVRPYEDNLDLRCSRASDRYRAAMPRFDLVNIHYGLIRSDVLRKTALIGNYPGSDIPLLLELLLYGQFWEIPQPLFFRRMHAQASSATTNKTLESYQSYWDPLTHRKVFMYRWMQLYSNAASIIRTPLGTMERCRLLYTLLRSGISARDELLRELSSALWHVVRPTKQALIQQPGAERQQARKS